MHGASAVFVVKDGNGTACIMADFSATFLTRPFPPFQRHLKIHKRGARVGTGEERKALGATGSVSCRQDFCVGSACPWVSMRPGAHSQGSS